MVFAFRGFFSRISAGLLSCKETDEQVGHLVSLAQRVGANVADVGLSSLLV